MGVKIGKHHALNSLAYFYEARDVVILHNRMSYKGIISIHW